MDNQKCCKQLTDKKCTKQDKFRHLEQAPLTIDCSDIVHLNVRISDSYKIYYPNGLDSILPRDIGYDLRACMETNVTIMPQEYHLFDTGIEIIDINARTNDKIASDIECFVYSRSNFNITHGLVVAQGVTPVDRYSGTIKVWIHNISQYATTVRPGETIAKLILCKYYQSNVVVFVNNTDSSL